MAEVLAAAALMSVVTVIALPIVSSVAAVREESAKRNQAVIEVANVMERVAALRRSGPVTAADLDSLTVSDSIADLLDESQLEITLSEPAGTPPSRELTVSLSWLNDAGDRVSPATVTAFLYESGETP
jgi:type II secretory pathway pseudopilin PulG